MRSQQRCTAAITTPTGCLSRIAQIRSTTAGNSRGPYRIPCGLPKVILFSVSHAFIRYGVRLDPHQSVERNFLIGQHVVIAGLRSEGLAWFTYDGTVHISETKTSTADIHVSRAFLTSLWHKLVSALRNHRTVVCSAALEVVGNARQLISAGPTRPNGCIVTPRTMSDLADGRYYILPATPSGPPALPIGGLTDKSPSPVVVGGGDRLWTVTRLENGNYTLTLEQFGQRFTEISGRDIVVDLAPSPRE
ncbi:hypothetical protein EV363DRAFT_1434836 [Boletus edulis]|nr:hypothetical protein EV363DRAFT_1434836 [Boletus edulis]